MQPSRVLDNNQQEFNHNIFLLLNKTPIKFLIRLSFTLQIARNTQLVLHRKFQAQRISTRSKKLWISWTLLHQLPAFDQAKLLPLSNKTYCTMRLPTKMEFPRQTWPPRINWKIETVWMDFSTKKKVERKSQRSYGLRIGARIDKLKKTQVLKVEHCIIFHLLKSRAPM